MSLLERLLHLHPAPPPPEDELLHWEPSLSVGNSLLDNEHREIIRLLNCLYNDWRSKIHHLDVARTLAILERTLEMHFTNEEDVMNRHNCPVLQGHHHAHSALLQELAEIHHMFRFGGGPQAEAILTNFLRKVVMDHVLTWDMDCKTYMRE